MIHYYYADNNQQLGPFTFEELKSKRIKKSTLVWREDMPAWVVADTVEELEGILVSEPPPLPPPIIIKKPIVPKTSLKYDLSYTKESGAAFVGVVLFVVPIVLVLSRNTIFETNQSYEESRTFFAFASLVIRIAVSFWVVQIASRQNRNSTIWGSLAFFIPSITLLIIGQLRKLRFKIEVESNLPSNQQVSILLGKANNLYGDIRYSECILVLDRIIELDNLQIESIKTRALCNYMLKSYDNSKIDFETLVQREKFLGVAYYHLGNIEVINNNSEKAVEFWIKAKENGNDDAQSRLNLYHRYTGKYLLERPEVLNKISTSSVSQCSSNTSLKYVGGFNQIDVNEDINRLKATINVYDNGLQVELYRTFKSYRLAIAYYEIEDITLNDNKTNLTLILKDKTSLSFIYDKIYDYDDCLKLICDKYTEATCKTSSASSILN